MKMSEPRYNGRDSNFRRQDSPRRDGFRLDDRDRDFPISQKQVKDSSSGVRRGWSNQRSSREWYRSRSRSPQRDRRSNGSEFRRRSYSPMLSRDDAFDFAYDRRRARSRSAEKQDRRYRSVSPGARQGWDRSREDAKRDWKRVEERDARPEGLCARQSNLASRKGDRTELDGLGNLSNNGEADAGSKISFKDMAKNKFEQWHKDKDEKTRFRREKFAEEAAAKKKRPIKNFGAIAKSKLTPDRLMAYAREVMFRGPEGANKLTSFRNNESREAQRAIVKTNLADVHDGLIQFFDSEDHILNFMDSLVLFQEISMQMVSAIGDERAMLSSKIQSTLSYLSPILLVLRKLSNAENINDRSNAGLDIDGDAALRAGSDVAAAMDLIESEAKNETVSAGGNDFINSGLAGQPDVNLGGGLAPPARLCNVCKVKIP